MTEGGGGGKITAIERDSLIGYRLFFPDNSILISHLNATEGGERWVGEKEGRMLQPVALPFGCDIPGSSGS